MQACFVPGQDFGYQLHCNEPDQSAIQEAETYIVVIHSFYLHRLLFNIYTNK